MLKEGLEYRRKNGKKLTVHRECPYCKTVWDVNGVANDYHMYGVNNCPFCHTPIPRFNVIKLGEAKPKKTASMERKLLRLQERVKIIDAMLFNSESVPVQPANVKVFQGAKEHHEEWEELRNKAWKTIGSIGILHAERAYTIAKITEIERRLAKAHVYAEPPGIRLPDGQMNWDKAYANMFEYLRDKR